LGTEVAAKGSGVVGRSSSLANPDRTWKSRRLTANLPAPMATEASILRPANEVHVWRAGLDSPIWPVADLLPARERDRAARLRPPHKRRRWVAARWALRVVLGRYLAQAPAEIALCTGAHGKPALAGRSTGLRFNLSHSAGLALIAVSQGRDVGVDVEWVDPRRDVLVLASRALRPAEVTAVRRAPAATRSHAFHAAWARREALAKCHGGGLAAPLPPVPLAVANIDAGAEFAAALAVEGDEAPPLRHLTLEPNEDRSGFRGA
jgi:4'-phosphopantetheinyl transferase